MDDTPFRTSNIGRKDIPIKEESQLPGFSGKVMDLPLEGLPSERCTEFTMEITKGDSFHTDITLFPKKGTIRQNRSFSGFPMIQTTFRSFLRT